MKILAAWLIGLTLLPAATAFGALSEAEKLDLYHEGKRLFREANEAAGKNADKARELYGRAALRFERLAKEGPVRNGKLYYNIGNAYFRMGDVGRAILYYRRAERYIPDDINLQQNLAYARSRRLDRLEEPQRARVLKTLLFWHYDLPTRARATAFAILFLAFWAGLAVRLTGRGRPSRAAVGAVGCVAALLLASLLYEAAVENTRPAGVIVAGEVVARKGDGTAFQPSFREPLHAGAEFVLRERRDDWLRIALPDGRECWVPVETAALVTTKK